uniref:Reverse transcriptase domain-containing protein n=1 Tax=Megaselia scalaris TaxID=36166 RepID=T1GNL1_MEGSC
MQILGYADYVGRTTSSISSVFMRLKKEARLRGLRVNVDKTKCMVSSRIQSHLESLGPIFTIGDYDFEVLHVSESPCRKPLTVLKLLEIPPTAFTQLNVFASVIWLSLISFVGMTNWFIDSKSSSLVGVSYV